MNRIMSSSVIIQRGKSVYNFCCILNQRFRNIYFYSNTHRLVKIFRERIKIYSRYSLLGRLTEINETTLVDLSGSRVIQRLACTNQKLEAIKTHSLESSSVLNLIKRKKKKPVFASIRTISTIFLIAVSINIILSFVLEKQIDLWGWIIRGMFLVTATSGLLCKVDLSTAAKNSLLLKKRRID